MINPNNPKCLFCDCNIQYTHCWDSHNNFYSQFICRNHPVLIKFAYRDSSKHDLECIGYKLDNYIYKCDFSLNLTTIKLDSQIKFSYSNLLFKSKLLFKANSIILIQPKDLKRKLTLLTYLQ